MTTRKDKVIVIGLDGATWDIIDPMIEKGKLPNLRKIIANGTSGYLTAPIDPNSFASWAEFATGAGPDKHSIFCSQKRRINNYKCSTVNFKDIKVKTFWRIISKQGGKVGIVNVPMTYPPEKINGFLISGIIVPSDATQFTYPPELSLKLLELGYSVEEVLFASKNWENYEQLLDAVIQCEKRRLEVSLYLKDRYDPDLFVVVFTGLDRIQHYFWHFFDKSHSMYVPSANNKFKEAIPNFYELLDEFVGKILKNIPENTKIIIISDHGFESCDRIFSLNRWLANEGYLKWEKSISTKIRKLPLNLMDKLGLKDILKKVIPNKLKNQAENFKQDLRFKAIDWSRTTAYSGDNGHISINLKGREPEGIVDQNGEYQKLIHIIKNQLLNSKDPISGQNIFKEVLLRDEVFRGKHRNNIPDIIVNSQIKGFIPHARLDHKYKLISSVSEINKDQNLILSGTHNTLHARDGIFISAGKDLKKNQQKIKLKMMDIAPTILYLMDMLIPENIDGKIVKYIFNSGYLKRIRPKYGGNSEIDTTNLNDESAEINDADIRKKLKGLGYL